MRQVGLFGLSDQLKRLSDCGDPLETMGRVVDFEVFRPALEKALARGGSVCLHRLAAWISGLPLVDHAAARSGCPKYTWSGVRPPRAECGLTAL